MKSDRGGEFTGIAFVEHLRAKGIKVEHSPVGTPKFDARIERLHGTLFPMLRAVLHERGLPLNLILIGKILTNEQRSNLNGRVHI